MAKLLEISPKDVFLKITSDLKNNPAVALEHISELFQATNIEFVYSQQELGIVLSDDINSCYESANGCRFTWKYEDRFLGEANIIDIGSFTIGFLDDFWKNGLKKYRSKEDKIFRQFWETVNSLDIFEDTYDGTLRVVAELKKKSPEPQSPPLWIWHLAGEKYPLTLSIPQYWQALAKTRGFAGWPYFFIDLEKCKFEDAFFRKYFSVNVLSAIPSMEEFLKTMPALFPKDDFSEFESLYKSLKASL